MPSAKSGKSYQRVTRCPQTLTSGCPEKRDRHDSPSSMPVAHVDGGTSSSAATPREDDAERPSNGGVGNDGEFQTVATKGARRKEKLREQHRDSHRERHRLRENNNRHQPPRGASGVGGGGAGRRGSDERSHRERVDRNGVLDHSKEAYHHKEEQSGEAETQSASLHPPPVKYVEAPLPAVNPWTKNRTSAPQTAKTVQQQQQQQPPPQPSNVLTASTCADKQSERERRVPQPQQQDATGELEPRLLEIA